MKALVAVAITVSFSVSSLACNRIPGFGKKDGGDEGGTSSSGGKGGGVLSFLGGAFEGEITMQVTGKSTQGPMTLVFGIKQPKYRIDMAGGQAGAASNPMLAQGGAFILDPPSKTGTVLVMAQKKAMVIDFNKAKEMRLAHPGGAGGTATGGTPDPADIPKIDKTGVKETIAGYECEDWKITTKKTHADVCVAEGIKWFDLTDLGMASPEIALTSSLADFNHFPLKVITYDAQNQEDTRMVAQKIEKKKLDDSRFQVPAGFQVVDMTSMLGNLQNMGAGGPGGMPPGFTPPAKKH